MEAIYLQSMTNFVLERFKFCQNELNTIILYQKFFSIETDNEQNCQNTH